ncbi:hypothetical protein HXA31_20245 [Salipaludibacillus agaradhaerens]|jgi:hypothetical protein|uniref:Uncharacterized protein n=1 Tax=Salipaludibacillus agaradhaerens TaxID=76935 RepID=A0A9Q4B223_SALAG|nr:hypothetical protein [Salipaludibacillus agaradhaerens]MCR6096892.1 hypothetical protein [Salipaludibacillus agaradhaerens]MCR6116662.1 hypothetical protein [Salipaludibacillus agaradhaerens]
MTIQVTKKQQELINSRKERGIPLRMIIKRSYECGYEYEESPLNAMSDKQIAAAFLGVAEIEREYVSFGEAMEAFKEGKVIAIHVGPHRDEGYVSLLQKDECDTPLGFLGKTDIECGKWTIEEESP